MTKSGGGPKFLVVQFGARHNYAIPAALARRGALERVYTDLVADRGLGSGLRAFSKRLDRRGQQGIRRRTVPVELEQSLFTFGEHFLVAQLGERFGHLRSLLKPLASLTVASVEQRMIQRGTGEATHVYTMLGEGGRFIRACQKRGLAIFADVYIALSAEKIVRAEQAAFPDWGEYESDQTPLPEDRVLLECADLFICPSAFVRDDLVANFAIPIEKTAIVPYAVGHQWVAIDPAPQPGRVLFAGTANLRKGIHYFAFAAGRLSNLGWDFRVAGTVSDAVRCHPDARNLNILGHLSPGEMATELKHADVLVLPSLAEGSAGVTAEAMGAGVPVITTKAAGSIVRDGIDGLIVPERDATALATAISTIVSDRSLRARMSEAARTRAKQFSWDTFAEAVIALAAEQTGKKVN